jgi:hypothetical protein
MAQPIAERIGIFAAIALAVATACVGAKLSTTMHDAHWMNRAGALVVCLEGVLGFVEYSRRRRIRLAEERFSGNPYIAVEAGRAERRILLVSGTMAIAGEILHGFGDLLIEFYWAL